MLVTRIKNARTHFRQGGIPAVLQAGKDRFLLTITANKKNVLIDGCQFEFGEVKDEFMRLLLLRGTYEEVERGASARYIRRDAPIIELGGCLGVVACTTNKLLRNPRDHVVVEASPLVVPLLKKNRDLNDCKFEIVNSALGYGDKYLEFRPASSFVGNSMHVAGDLEPVRVPTIGLSELVRGRGFETFALLCDVEGSEYEMVLNDADTLTRAEVIVLESHPWILGEERSSFVLSRLQELGFSVVEECVYVTVLKNQNIK